MIPSGIVAFACMLVADGSAASASLTLVMGSEIQLRTLEALSSKTHVKGDMVRLAVSKDVRVGDHVAIPAGTEAVGQVVDARAKGAMGMSGRLVVRPLYLQVKGWTIRLSGAEREKASPEAGAVIGMIALGTIAFTGRSAAIPAGTPILAIVERTVLLEP